MAEPDRIDFIAIDRQTMLDFHGKYTFLQDIGKLSLFETENLIDLTTHPVTGEDLSIEEKTYIKFHYDCYEYTDDMILSPETLTSFFTWYDKMRKIGKEVRQLKEAPDTEEAFNIVRFYLTATDFQSHFKEFNPLDSEQERYERDLAEKALRQGETSGLWLLRHSSLNRPVTPEAIEKLQVLGVRYYALSYIDDNGQIQHKLLTHAVGIGWKESKAIFPCFLDCLEYTLHKYKIPYNKRIDKYAT